MKYPESTPAEAMPFGQDLMSYGDPNYQHLFGVSKEPQLVCGTHNNKVYNLLYREMDKDIKYEELEPEDFHLSMPEFVPKVVTDLIPAFNRSEFLFYYQHDNWEPINIDFKPDLWLSKAYIYHKLIDYCKQRKINYYFLWEIGKNNSNLHIHGIFGFPNGPSRKRFQVWVNKYLGKFHQGSKEDPKGDGSCSADLNRWYDYVHNSNNFKGL